MPRLRYYLLAALLATVVACGGSSTHLENRASSDFGEGIQWCSDQNVNCAFTEFGTPGDQYHAGDSTEWNTILEGAYDAFENAGIWSSQWGTSDAFTNYELAPFTASGGIGTDLNTQKPQATPLVNHAADTGGRRCVALGGLEFGTGGSFSNTNPGTYGTDYYPQSAVSYVYLASKGITCVRVGISWERIQPTLNAALNSTYKGYLDTQISRAATAGVDVIIDVHNYGRYITSGGTLVFGDGTLTSAKFTDLWGRLASAYGGNSTVIGYELMNEPYSLVGGLATWKSYSDSAANGIRYTGSTKPILVATYNYSKCQNASATNGNKWVTATGPIRYVFHCYNDSENSTGNKENSVYNETVATAEQDAINAGF